MELSKKSHKELEWEKECSPLLKTYIVNSNILQLIKQITIDLLLLLGHQKFNGHSFSWVINKATEILFHINFLNCLPFCHFKDLLVVEEILPTALLPSSLSLQLPKISTWATFERILPNNND